MCLTRSWSRRRDSESPVTGGQIEIAPQGTSNWTALSTALTSAGQLVAMIPDAGLNGPYTIQATACSQVGNCGSTSETMTMPLRVTAQSDVSFDKVIAPAKVVRERVLVGWHYKRERRHGKPRRVRVGGHLRKIRVVIRTNASCATRRVKTGRRRWQEIKVCRERKLKLMTHELVRFRHPATVHGVLLSGQGVPIANTGVQIWTAPDNGLDQFTQVASTTTSSDGAWAITLPAGPSRLVQARYPGSPTILPATGQVTLTVPAKIRILSVTPRHVPWGATVKITGELAGGYLPASGELVELFYSYGRHKTPYNVKTHVTTRRFTTSFTFGPGQTPLTFGFQMHALPDPAYAYAPASSNTIDVRVGGHISPSSLASGRTKRHRKADRKANTKHKAKAKKQGEASPPPHSQEASHEDVAADCSARDDKRQLGVLVRTARSTPSFAVRGTVLTSIRATATVATAPRGDTPSGRGLPAPPVGLARRVLVPDLLSASQGTIEDLDANVTAVQQLADERAQLSGVVQKTSSRVSNAGQLNHPLIERHLTGPQPHVRSGGRAGQGREVARRERHVLVGHHGRDGHDVAARGDDLGLAPLAPVASGDLHTLQVKSHPAVHHRGSIGAQLTRLDAEWGRQRRNGLGATGR